MEAAVSIGNIHSQRAESPRGGSDLPEPDIAGSAVSTDSIQPDFCNPAVFLGANHSDWRSRKQWRALASIDTGNRNRCGVAAPEEYEPHDKLQDGHQRNRNRQLRRPGCADEASHSSW